MNNINTFQWEIFKEQRKKRLDAMLIDEKIAISKMVISFCERDGETKYLPKHHTKLIMLIMEKIRQDHCK